MYPPSRPSLPLSGSCVGENCSTNEEPSREGWRVEVISQDREIVPWAARHRATVLTRLDSATLYRVTHILLSIQGNTYSTLTTGWHIFLLFLQGDTYSALNTGWHVFYSCYRMTHFSALSTGWHMFYSYYRVTHIIYLIGLYTGWRIIPPACTGVMVLSGCDQATGLWRRCHWYQSRDLSVCPDRIQDT